MHQRRWRTPTRSGETTFEAEAAHMYVLWSERSEDHSLSRQACPVMFGAYYRRHSASMTSSVGAIGTYRRPSAIAAR